MTIDEAIQMLAALSKDTNAKKMPTITASIKLGIEALKAVAKMRHYPFPDEILQLPGETKD
ncbi:hypothetical protein ES708_21919 [subsurface metagenome]